MAKRFFWFMIVAVFFMVAVGLWGCSPKTVYVPVETTRVVHDSVKVSSTLLDRFVERDTVRERINGDSVFIEVIRWRWRDREIHDTVYQTRVDSVSVPVPYEVKVPYPVERKITAWETVRLWAFWPLVTCVAAIIVWSFLRRKRLVK